MEKLEILPSQSKLKKIQEAKALERRVASESGIRGILRDRSQSSASQKPNIPLPVLRV